MLVDASFQSESRRQLFLSTGRRWGIRTCLIVCEADAQTIRQRLDERRGDASDADWSIHSAMARQWEELSPATRMACRTLDTSGTQDEALDAALEVVRSFELF